MLLALLMNIDFALGVVEPPPPPPAPYPTGGGGGRNNADLYEEERRKLRLIHDEDELLAIIKIYMQNYN